MSVFSFLFDSWTRGPNTRTTPPTRPAGESGTAVYGGYLVEHERSQRLIGRSRYHTYGTMIANAPIIAAGIRLYATLVAGSQWSMTPAEADGSQAWADRAEQCVYHDPMQSWPRVIRRAAMYRYYGYSIQEWTMRKVDDGSLTFDRIDPRPQVTIERWDLDVTARTPLAGVVQLSEQSGDELYIARSKLLYLVDDALSDSPEGLGLLRQCVAPFDRLMRYYQLEGLGYETDLRGIPVGRVPFSENAKRIATGQLSPQQAKDAEQVVIEFVGRHIRTAQLGLVLDSAPYRKPDTSPTTDAEYGMEILKGSGTSHEAIEKAIERTTAELARIQSAEGLLLGSTSSGGAYALAKNKTANLHAAVNSALVEVRDGAQRDLVDTLWTLNMWPEDLKPLMAFKPLREQDVLDTARALADLATAGAVMGPGDPAVDEIRTELGLSHTPPPEDVGAAPSPLSATGDDVDEQLQELEDSDDPEVAEKARTMRADWHQLQRRG